MKKFALLFGIPKIASLPQITITNYYLKRKEDPLPILRFHFAQTVGATLAIAYRLIILEGD